MPNIIGTATLVASTSGTTSGTGAMSSSSNSATSNYGGGSGNDNNAVIRFDASTSNSIYGANNTTKVVTSGTAVYICIRY